MTQPQPHQRRLHVVIDPISAARRTLYGMSNDDLRLLLDCPRDLKELLWDELADRHRKA